MFSSQAKQGYFVDFSDSKIWNGLAMSLVEVDSKHPDSNAGFDELVERLIAEKKMEQLTGGLSLGFKFGGKKHSDFWEKEKEALISNLAPEYEDLRSKISAGVFRVSVKPKKVKPGFISSIITSFSRVSTKPTQVMSDSLDIGSEVILPKVTIKKESLSTMVVTSSSDSFKGEKNLKKRNSIIPF